MNRLTFGKTRPESASDNENEPRESTRFINIVEGLEPRVRLSSSVVVPEIAEKVEPGVQSGDLLAPYSVGLVVEDSSGLKFVWCFCNSGQKLPINIKKFFHIYKRRQRTLPLTLVASKAERPKRAEWREFHRDELNLPSELPADSPVCIMLRADDQGQFLVSVYICSDEYIDKHAEIIDDGILHTSADWQRYLVDPTKEPGLEPTTGVESTRSELLAALLATVSKGAAYEQQAAQLEGLIGGVRQQAAAHLLPALKDEMRRRDHATYDQKVELVAWVNTELRRFGMAIKHPKTGEAAILKPSPGNHPDVGSFELGGKDTEGRRTTFTTPDLDTLLGKLELMDAPPRREALAEWQATVGRDRRGAKRG